MTIKELKQNILLSLYHRYKRDKLTAITLKELCSLDKIIFDSTKQVSDAASGLKQEGYINVTLFEGGDGIITGLTPLGIEYVEENLLSSEEQIIDGLSDTDRLMKSGAKIYLDIENHADGVSDDASADTQSIKTDYYHTTEQYRPIIDTDATPCFGVDSVADCYIKQLDKIANSKTDSTKMLGIFGSWGRGKTFFFKRLRDIMENRDSGAVKYRVVEFNAWKYQDTPALWAYLYESIYKTTSGKEKIGAYIHQLFHNVSVLSIGLYLLLLGMAWIYGYFAYLLSSDAVGFFLNELKFPATVCYLFGCLVRLFKGKSTPVTARSLIKRYGKRKSYKNYLGIQNEIEWDLQILLRTMVRDESKARVVLYVEDVDRCTPSKMSMLIESLRTVLENPEIKKRLIVICSIDENKLMRSYYMDLESMGFAPGTINQYVRAQLDKLFLFGVKLAALDQKQLNDYLCTLINDSNNNDQTDRTASKGRPSERPYSVFRLKGAMIPTNASDIITEFNEETIKNIFYRFLNGNTSQEFTPRKIRIMYYQLLFGLSLSAKGSGAFTEALAEAILRKSVGLPSGVDGETAMSDIVDMVVPY